MIAWRKSQFSLLNMSLLLSAYLALCAAPSAAQLLSSPFETSLGQKYKSELEFLAVSEKLLPEHCVLKLARPQIQVIQIRTNPFVSEYEDEIHRIVELIGAQKRNVPKQIIATFGVLYEDRDTGKEFGIWALRFSGQEESKEAHMKLGRKSRNIVQRKGAVLYTGWMDLGADKSCLKALQKILKARKL